MIKIRVLLIAGMLLATPLLPGQEKPGQAKNEPWESAIIPVKTLTGDSFKRLVSLLNVFSARISSDEKLRTIVVYAPKEVVAEVRRVVEQLDKPGSGAAIGRNIEMTLAFLRSSTDAATAGPPLPADLEAVAKQLRAATQYRSFQLVDVVPLHVQEGKETYHSFRLPQSLHGIPNAFPISQIRLRPESITRRDSGRFVRFDYLKISFRIPYVTGTVLLPNTNTEDGKQAPSKQYNFAEVSLDTAGDFKEGQKTVLGKLSGLDDGSTIFAVISLKILD